MMELAVGFAEESLCEQARLLAESLQLPLNNQAPNRLWVSAQRLELVIQGFSALWVDFTPQRWQKRRDAGKQQGLIQACKPRPGLRIVDSCAGWGRDAALLASYGAQVTMIERNPIMAALLADGLKRMPPTSTWMLTLVQQDAKQYLSALPSTALPDVIYVDPMHPERQKSALVKKDMQILQRMLGADTDAHALLAIARRCARERVVIKWPQQLASILPPDRTVSGKTVRFDIYLATS